MSAWTTAIITNDNNTTQAGNAVALSEADSTGTVCVDTASTASNTATCTDINKYGGTAAPLQPGQSKTTTVTMKNTGNAAGALTLKAGPCTHTGGPAGSTANICDQVQVTVACPTGTTTYGPGTLTAFAAVAAPTAVSSLAAGASVACDFTVSLPANAPSGVAGMIAAQQLTWTLTAS